jgi:hypothetical protein
VALPTTQLLVGYHQVDGQALATATEMRRLIPRCWDLDDDGGLVNFIFNAATIEESDAREMVLEAWQKVDPQGQHLRPA